jgi:hypothetical protein
MTMATLALGPTFPVRPQSGSKRDHRKHRVRGAQRTPWRTIAITAGAISIGFFSVSAPLIGDPSGRLFALDAAPVIRSVASFGGDAWPVRAFEFTPTLLGPAITNDLLSLADNDWPVLVMMPMLEIRALPPIADDGTSPRG